MDRAAKLRAKRKSLWGRSYLNPVKVEQVALTGELRGAYFHRYACDCGLLEAVTMNATPPKICEKCNKVAKHVYTATGFTRPPVPRIRELDSRLVVEYEGGGASTNGVPIDN